MTLKIALAALTSAFATTAAAHATVYDLTGQSYGNVSVTGSITTDSAMGVLTRSDITAVDITVSDQLGAFVLSLPVVIGDGLTASASSLFFDYSNTSASDVFGAVDLVSVSNYCIGSGPTGCFSSPTPNAESVEVNARVYHLPSHDQRIEIATAVSSAPEPSTWALMIAGLGGMGLALRRAERKSPIQTPQSLRM